MPHRRKKVTKFSNVLSMLTSPGPLICAKNYAISIILFSFTFFSTTHGIITTKTVVTKIFTIPRVNLSLYTRTAYLLL